MTLSQLIVMAQFVIRCRRSVECLSAEGKKSYNGSFPTSVPERNCVSRADVVQ